MIVIPFRVEAVVVVAFPRVTVAEMEIAPQGRKINPPAEGSAAIAAASPASLVAAEADGETPYAGSEA